MSSILANLMQCELDLILIDYATNFRSSDLLTYEGLELHAQVWAMKPSLSTLLNSSMVKCETGNPRFMGSNPVVDHCYFL